MQGLLQPSDISKVGSSHSYVPWTG